MLRKSELTTADFDAFYLSLIHTEQVKV